MTSSPPDEAVVVGSGPNGLAAAVRLAQAGVRVVVLEANDTIGGSARSAPLVRPDVIHDVCSAVHPLAVASPYLANLPLAEHGLGYVRPEVAAAHPLDGGRAAVLWNDLDRTVDELGRDGLRWRRLIGGLADHLDELLAEVLRPVLHVPRSPIVLGRFGAGAVLPASVLTRLAFRDEPARALFAGLAAHTIAPLHHPLTSAIGLVLGATAHRVGWPLARGGSQQITDALAALLRSLGGEIVTGHRVERLADVDGGGAVLFDTTPGALARIAADALPERYRRRLAAYRHGVGTFKVDYVLDGPVPWADERCGLAGTVHLGGTAAEVAEAEAAVWRGTEPARPFVLVAQPSVVDPGRAPEGLHVLWAYAHTTRGSTADRREAIDAQIERFAPGFARRVVGAVTHDSAQLEAGNANLVGGDVVGGAPTGLQLVFRPVVGRNPYATPHPRLFLCSAATPPGAGVHGMCGYWAAEAVLAGAR